MKVNVPALLPILRSDAVGEILARLYLAPDRAWTLTELAAATGVSLPTLTREVTRMVRAGLLTEERVGRTRQVRCNRDAATFPPLQQLVVLTYGPVPVLQEVLGPVRGIDEAYIYGSWAARHGGVEGPGPNDIDVLVLGNPDPDELFDAAERARGQLHREVSIRTVSPGALNDVNGKDPFLSHVSASPRVPLDLQGES